MKGQATRSCRASNLHMLVYLCRVSDTSNPNFVVLVECPVCSFLLFLYLSRRKTIAVGSMCWRRVASRAYEPEHLISSGGLSSLRRRRQQQQTYKYRPSDALLVTTDHVVDTVSLLHVDATLAPRRSTLHSSKCATVTAALASTCTAISHHHCHR